MRTRITGRYAACAMLFLLMQVCVPVQAQRAVPVTVTNPDAAPVPVVTDSERIGRSAFATRFSVAFGVFRGISTSDRVAGDDFQVPAGATLVVEYITLRATMSNADQIGFVEVRSTSGGSEVAHVLGVRNDLATLPVGATQKIVSQNWPIKIYADAGSDVILNLNSVDGSPGGSAVYTVSGYLVPTTSTTLGD